MSDRILRFLRRRRLAASCVFSIAVAVPAVLLTAAHVARNGEGFYRTGHATVEVLDRFADALAAGDAGELAALHAATFEGEPLALLHPVLEDDRNGVRVHGFRSPGGRVTRDGAVEGWMRYLAGFESVERIEMHVHRLEDWNEPEIVATVRFELIGTPRGASRAGIDRALFRMRFRTEDGARTVTAAELVEGDRVSAERPRFVEVGEPAGVAFENRYYPPFLSEPLAFGMIRHGPGGITAADYDGDGLHDLFVPDGVESRLLRNRGDGTFEDVTAATGLSGLSGVSVALFADYDDDGWKDLFVSRTFEPNQLFRSNGPDPERAADGGVTFTDVTAQSGIGADCCTTVASWGDYDNDGDLDLYVGRYLDPRERIPTTFYARNGEPNRLYRNEGDGTFTDVTLEAGVGDPGLCLGSAFGDYDGDGWLDLWVANDFGRKTLYRNRGPGENGVTFEDVTAEAGALAYGAGMSSTLGDYDNDGDLDLYVAHIRSEHAWYAEAPTVRRYMLNSFRQGVWYSDMPLYWEIFRQSGTRFVEVFQQMASGNTLLRNRGDGAFDDVTWEADANPPGWFWGTSFADFDNDGWLDLYAANGWVYGARDTEIELEFLNSVVSRQDVYKTGALFDPDNFEGRSWHGWQRNRHLRNNGDGTFEEIGRAAGTDLLLNSRGIAVADFWNRGVLDLAVAASADRHALLANRPASGRRWLAVEVVGAGRDLPDGTNRDGVGARVTVTAGGLTQVREVLLGDGYGSQNALRQHFGLGAAARVDQLTVHWPRSGRMQTFRDVEPNRILRVVEGRDDLEELSYPATALTASLESPPAVEDLGR